MNPKRLPARFCALICAALVIGLLAPAAQALQTDLAAVPLITSAPQTVLPNLLYVLDDSGSMSWTHMPDDALDFSQSGVTARYGYRSAQCNGVYYNPQITYSPPVDATGASYASAVFTNALTDGFDTGSGHVNLATAFYAYTPGTLTSSGVSATDPVGGAAYYFTYSGTQTTQAQKNYSSGTFYNECASAIGSAPGKNVFAKVTVGASSGPGATDERTNFANWYSYYRTRMQMMKSSSGLAFKNIGDNYRVGYLTLNNNAGSSFINPTTFDNTAKSAWYAKLYGAVPSNSTALRGALANAGRLYANKLTGKLNGVSVSDPVQYSCQKNFTLLSTDGYWNDPAAPTQLDGSTAIGNQDSAEARPFNDGGSVANIYTASITVSGSSATLVSTIKVGSGQLLSSATSATGNTQSKNVAASIANNINSKTGTTGYTAVVSGSKVSITAPSSA